MIKLLAFCSVNDTDQDMFNCPEMYRHNDINDVYSIDTANYISTQHCIYTFLGKSYC